MQLRTLDSVIPSAKKYEAGHLIGLPLPLVPTLIALNGHAFTTLSRYKIVVAGIPIQEQKYVSIAWSRISESNNEILWSWSPLEIQREVKFRENIELSHEVQRRIADAEGESDQRKNQRLKKAYELSGGELDACWKRPLPSRVMSPFGSRRTLSDKVNYFHTGVDLRAAIGTPVRAPQGGRVVFVDDLAITGKTVAIYHGGGILSKIAHMDKIWVTENEEIQKDQVLGLSGNTGRSTGPHLHWEVVWKGIPLDPLEFLQFLEPICGPS